MIVFYLQLLKPAIRGTKIMIINSNWNKRTENESY